MSTHDILMEHLPQQDGCETHLAGVIQDFSHSRTVDELVEHTRGIISGLTGEKNGMTPGAFMNILRLGVSSQGIGSAKNCFPRARYDPIEWDNLGPAIQEVLHSGL